MYNYKEIANKYLQGHSTKKIAEELGTYNTTIRRILLKEGILLRNCSEAQTSRINMFSDVLTSENTQYWVGFLAADGCVSTNGNCISLTSSLKDEDHLKKYAEFTKCPLRYRKNKKLNILEPHVSFKNKEIKQFLISLGITPVKSKNILLKIPLTFNVLRGIIDGDGYVRMMKNKRTVEIASCSIEFALQIHKFLFDNHIHSTINTLKSGLNIVGIYKQKDNILLYNELYKNATVFLKRKQCNAL